MSKVLLYSGGMDSWLINKLWKPDKKIYINIHGKYSEEEIKRLPNDVEIIDFPFLGLQELDNAFIPLRNLYFLMIATHYGEEVCLGATSGDGGKDKSLDFLIKAESLISDLWKDKKIYKEVKIKKDFVKLSKGQLIDKYIQYGGTIDEIKNSTFSCYTPNNDKECFDCYPCFRKFALLYTHGAIYTDEEKRKMWDYIKNNIIPTKEEGGYEGTYYTDRGEESIYLIKCVEDLKNEYN